MKLTTTSGSGRNFFFSALLVLSALLSSSSAFAVTNEALSSTNPAIPAGNICNPVKAPVYAFSITATGTAPIPSLTSVVFTSQAGYAPTDITKFQLWHSTTNNINTAVQLGSDIVTTLGPGSHNFSGLSLAIGSPTVEFFWITVDLAGNPAIGNTISVAAITNAGLTFTNAPTQSGGAFAGGLQTILLVPVVSAVSGPSTLCAGTSATYNAFASPNTATYTWAVPPGAVINTGQGTPSINVTFGITSGNVSVTANNACGSSSPFDYAITVLTIPAQPGPVAGPTAVCDGTSNVHYGVSPQPNTTSWTWLVPPGATIITGQGSTDIYVDFNGASSGNVSVIANNPCGSSSPQMLAVTVNPHPVPAPQASPNPVCEGGNVTLQGFPNGMTSYSWTGPNGFSINQQNPFLGNVSSSFHTGDYFLSVIDANGCVGNPNFVHLTVNPNPTLSPDVTSVTCYGYYTGAISSNVSGGTPPYIYSWSDDETTPDISALGVGTYTVSVTDANGCSVNSGNLDITQPSAFGVSPGVTDLTCYYSYDGEISTSTYGGTLPYAYAWSNGQTDATATGLLAGTYTVLITDANGCTIDVGGLDVTQPNMLVVDAGPDQTICQGNSIAIGGVTFGGTTPYNYDWSPAGDLDNASAATPIATPSSSTEYMLAVTDAHGCFSTSTMTVHVNNPTNWYADADEDGYGDGSQVISACFQPMGYVADNTDCDDAHGDVHPGATDIPGNSIDEDCSGADAVAGAALNFDGADDYVQMQEFNLGSSDFTVEAWIKPNPLATSAYIVTNRTTEFGGDGNWWNLQLQATNIIGFEMGADGSPSYTFMPGNQVLSSGVWTHIAAVRNGTHIYLYVNGILDADYEDDFVRNLTSGNNIGRLGGWVEPSQGWYNGSMDEVRIWHVAKTQAEIQASMNCEAPSQANLAAAYHFNQGGAGTNNASETILTDASASVNNGALLNFALTGNSSNWDEPGGVTTGNSCEPPVVVAASALNFDGVDDEGEYTGYLVPVSGSPYTVSVWAKQDAFISGTWREIFAQGRYLYVGSSNLNDIRVGDYWLSTGVPFPTDLNYHNYTVVRATDNTYLYLDGSLVATAGYAIPSPETTGEPGTTNFYIGTQWWGDAGGERWNGSIDELRVWNRALAAYEIQDNLNCETATTSNGLVADYHFNQGNSGANNSGEIVVHDNSGNGHGITLHNMTLNGNSSNWVDAAAVPTGSSCSNSCSLSLSYTSNNACNEDTTAGSIDLTVNNATSEVTYAWSDEASTEDRSNLTAGTYIVTVSQGLGCDATASIVISQIQCFETPVEPPTSGSDSSSIGAELTGVYTDPPAPTDTTSSTIVTVSDDGYVFIDVIPQQSYYDSVLALIQTEAYGMTDPITDDTTLIITGFYPIAHIPLLDTLHAYGLLNFSRNAIPPILNNVGLFATGGDAAQRSDTARKIFSVTGDGIKVGVISDSYNKTAGDPAALDVSNGDLPGAAVTETPVFVRQDYPFGALTDEGRAMLQIVHDIAPKATLEFRTGYISPADFADAIRELASDGCNIIVDDITYPTEPYFQDGLVSNAVDEVTAQGVSYFTAAGNFGSRSYSGVFTGAGSGNKVHKFGTDSFGNDDTLQSVTLTPGRYTIVLQWDNQFYSLNQLPGASDDLDIFLVNNNGTKIGFNRNNLLGDPVEVLAFQVKGTSPVTSNIMIKRNSGSTANLKFKYIVFRGSLTQNEYSAGTSTIVGQANSIGAITVGAARYTQTPAYGVNPPLVESFSSRGGHLVNSSDRNKPDISAPDGGNTSVNFGSVLDPEGDTKPNFFGTSAAAPHAAAVAALIQEAKNKFTGGAASSSEIRSMLKSTAIDIGVAGDDTTSGSGLIQADLAIETFANPAPLLYSMTPEAGATPGSEVFTVDVYGKYFASNATLTLRQIAVPTTVIDENHLVATVPTFVGNPAVQVYNPPIASLGLDGGYSDTLFFYTSTRQSINITAADRTKRFGERLPAFTANITINGTPIESTSLTLADLRLDNIVFSTNATSQSNTGYYYIRPSSTVTLDPNNPADAELLDSYTYHFNDGLLTINKLPLVITPNNMTVSYGDPIDGTGISFNYNFDNSNIDPTELSAFTNSMTSSYESSIINQVALIDDRDAYNSSTLSELDLANLALLSGTRAVTNGTRAVINGTRAVTNNTTYVVDVAYQSLVQYNTDGSEATLTDDIMLLNGTRGVTNGTRAVINSASLADGSALINGTRAVTNGTRAVANGTRGVINGEELDGSSNTNTAVIIYETDVDGHDNTDSTYQMYAINGITGLTAGTHWIVPGGFMSANFDVSYQLGTLTVNEWPLTVTADDKNGLCSGEQPTYTSSINGFQYDDSASVVFSSLTYHIYDSGNNLMGSGPLAQGYYTITPNPSLVTPANYSFTTANGTLSVASPLSITASGNILCHDGSATVTVNVTGGTAPYSSLSAYPNQGPGEHTYTVTDAHGCTASVTITLVNPPALSASLRVRPATCAPGTGSIDVSPAGGTPGYTYLWTPGGQTGATATGLASGNYSVRVTDANGCSITYSTTLTNPTVLSGTTTVSPTSCSGATGSAYVSPSGGTGAYTYLWTPGNASTQTVSNLAAGAYSVRITDANGCSTTLTATISSSSSMTAVTSQVNCTYWHASNGSASVSVSGGTLPYTYSWNSSPVQTTATATALNARTGGYTVVITDANGCSISRSVTITEPVYSCGNLNEYTDAEIGGWGAPPNGNNITNTWLYPYFSTVFPTGIVIGGYGRTLTFNCAQAITNYLPAAATSGQLPASYVNPVGGSNPTYSTIPCGTLGPIYKNTLASKTLALTINVKFDEKLPNFSNSFNVTYGDLVYTAAPFAGWTVKQILAEANRLLGQGLINGQLSTYYSTVESVITNIVAGSNERCPDNVAIRPEGELPILAEEMVIYPNPTSGDATVRFIGTGEKATVEVYSMNGAVDIKVFDKTIEQGQEYKVDINSASWSGGVYFVRLTMGENVNVKKLVIMNK